MDPDAARDDVTRWVAVAGLDGGRKVAVVTCGYDSGTIAVMPPQP